MKKKCKVCNKNFLDKLNLGNHPCADTFLKNKNHAIKLKRYPLVVGYCECSHLTSLHKVPEKERYEKYEYSYTSDNSPVSRLHFKKIAKRIIKYFHIKPNSFVVEAGSNDGTFLKEIKNFSKSKVLGVDPSKNISNIASKKKLDTFLGYFNFNNSKLIRNKYGKADIIYGANVFNHVDNNLDFLEGANHLLSDNGVLVLEVPDLNSLISKVGFDTIYHEHRHYYSEKSLNKILKQKKFYIFKIEKISYMAGSIRVFAKKNKNKFKKNFTSVSLSDFKVFKKKIKYVSQEIVSFVKDKNLNKIKVFGLGAATKGNTLLNYCKFTEKNISYILDKSKLKINKHTPGSGIKIVDENKFKNIESILILPWNITKHLKKKIMKNKKLPYISIQKIVNKI